MSLNKKGVQSEKPLGGSEKTEASNTNRILYGLLAILIAVFIWKISSEESKTVDMDIPDKKISVPHLFLDDETKKLNPSIEVEIEEAVTPIAEVVTERQTIPPKTEVYESGALVNAQTSPSQLNKNNTALNQHLADAEPKANDNYDYNNFSYIYAAEVEMAQGTYRGLDQDGFAKTNIEVREGILYSDNYTGINLTPIFEDRIGRKFKTSHQLPETKPDNNPVPELSKEVEEAVATKEKIKPSANYGEEEEAYPLQSTLPWHPYESLAYMREEKEEFVAEKVKGVPAANDLEPNINPSTLGDRDTRMGFGVVIRPRN